MKIQIKVVIYLSISLIILSNPLKSMSQEQKNQMKNITVHIITKLEITKVEYLFIYELIKKFSFFWDHTPERFAKAVIQSKQCNGKIEWEILNLNKIGKEQLPIDSYRRLLSWINSFLNIINKEELESYSETALLMSNYYSNKFSLLKINDQNYKYFADICDIWSSISDNLGEMIRNYFERNRLFDHLPLKKFTQKCFPNQQSVNQYKENFKKQEFSDPNKCYAIVSQEHGYMNLFIGIGYTLFNGFYESTLLGMAVSRQKIWRFIKSGFDSIYNQTEYKIQNCDSDEFLTVENQNFSYDNTFNKFLKMDFKYSFKIFVSKNPNIDEEKRNFSSNHWLIMPYEDGETYIITSCLNGLILTSDRYNSKGKSLILDNELTIFRPKIELWKFESIKQFPDPNNCYIIQNDLGKDDSDSTIIKYCKIGKGLKSNRLKCIVEPIFAKNDRSISWRFIRTGFNETLRKSTYKIQNCESNEYLVINNSLVDNSTLKYAFTISEESFLRDENKLNSLWVFENFHSIYSNFIIDAETYRYFLGFGENVGQNEQLIHAKEEKNSVWEIEKICV